VKKILGHVYECWQSEKRTRKFAGKKKGKNWEKRGGCRRLMGENMKTSVSKYGEILGTAGLTPEQRNGAKNKEKGSSS